MIAKEDYLLTFSSTHHALAAEDILKQVGIVIDVVPIPRTITAECGLAITFKRTDAGVASQLLVSHKIKLKACYFLNQNNCLEEKIAFLEK